MNLKPLEVVRFLSIFLGYSAFMWAIVPVIKEGSNSWLIDYPGVQQGILFMVLLAVPMASPVCIGMAAIIVSLPSEKVLEMWTQYVTTVPEFYRMGVILPWVSICTYWINGGILLLIDFFEYPSWLHTSKIQKSKKIRGEPLKKLLRGVAFNMLVLVPLIGLATYFIQVYSPRKLDFSLRVPSHLEVSLHFVFFVLLYELLFFYGHWLFHANKWLYANVHKWHHEYTAPNGLAAVYCHPVELLVSDFFPLGVGAFILESHAITAYLWAMYAVLATMTHHSGYRWPWVSPVDHQPDFHDFHHEKFNTNYGDIGFLDYLHGTMDPWLAMKRKGKEEKVE